MWVMDRGIPTEEVLAEMRAAQPPIHYLVGTPRARVRQTRSQWEALPWQKVKDTVEVKLFREGEELLVVAKSGGRQAKEIAMRRKKLAAPVMDVAIAAARALARPVAAAVGGGQIQGRPGGLAGGYPVAHRSKRDPEEAEAEGRTG